MATAVLKLLLVLAAAYAAAAAIMWAVQDRLLFPAHVAHAQGTPLAPDTPRVALDAPGGARLHGVRLVPDASPVRDRLIVLGFPGNAWNAEDAAAYLRAMFPQAEIVAFHYRGYGPSTGRASVAALLDDAPLIYDMARESAPEARIVAVGFSIGAGVAVHLARARPVDGLILVTPFDSLAALAADHFPWLPARALIRHPMKNAEMLTGLDVPAAIIAAENDTLVPGARTADLRAAARRLVLNRTIADADHTDIYGRQAFTFTMREAMERITMAWD